jgi:hypothetical protein
MSDTSLQLLPFILFITSVKLNSDSSLYAEDELDHLGDQLARPDGPEASNVVEGNISDPSGAVGGTKARARRLLCLEP